MLSMWPSMCRASAGSASGLAASARSTSSTASDGLSTPTIAPRVRAAYSRATVSCVVSTPRRRCSIAGSRSSVSDSASPSSSSVAGRSACRRRLLERAPQIGDGGVGRAARHRLAGGVAQPVAHPRGAARLGREQVRADALGGAVLLGEHARREPVTFRPGGRRQLLVDGAADDRVHEPQSARVGQDAPGAQRVGGRGGLAVVETGEPGGVAHEPAVAHDRGRAGQLLRRPREAREPCAHRRDDALRGGAEHVAGALGARVAQRVGELAQEERVAAGQLVAACGRAARRPRGRAARRISAAASPLSASGRSSVASVERVGDGGAAGLAERPGGDDEQHRQPLDPVGEVGQEPQRRAVRPVRVVDQQRQRAEVRGQPVEAVQRREGAFRPERQEGRLGELHVEQRRGAARRAVERRLVAVLHHRLEQLAHDAEAERALELGPACREARRPASRACASAAATSAVLPIPAGPSTTSTRPSPPATASAHATIRPSSSLRSRSSPSPSRVTGTTLCPYGCVVESVKVSVLL